MAQSLARVTLHLVFSTNQRRPWLRDDVFRDELYRYMALLFNDHACPSIIISGVEDHVHALCRLSRKERIMDLVKVVKTETSKWVKTRKRNRFAWQAGYGAFSVSESLVPAVRSYIENQQQHHRQGTFPDEFRELCRRHGVALDERYAWD